MSRPIYLVVTQHFPTPESWRGPFVYDLVRALQADGRYDVRVFMPGKGPDFDYQGVHVCRFPRRALRSAILPFLFAAHNRTVFLRKLQSEGIDPANVRIVHAHGVFQADYARLFKGRALTLLHHHDPASFGLELGILRHFAPHRALLRRQLLRLHRAIDCHVCISRLVERNFLAHFPSDPPRTLLLPNTVDPEVFSPSAPPSGPFTIGCVANFTPGKDQLLLLQALDKVRDRLPADWRLRFVGSGPFRKACEAFVQRAGLGAHVTFEAEQDHAQLPAFYRSLNLFVLPSSYEGFGCVYVEAAACGVPFIACSTAGIADLLPADAPELVPPLSVEALAARLVAFLEHPWSARTFPSIRTQTAHFLDTLETLR